MFTPWSFSPLVLRPALWLDASDASTLYDATTGGSLVAVDGTVARWEDKSGNARHATQSTGISQPLRKTAIQNGRDVVRFDGANDIMLLATGKSILRNVPAASICAVYKWTTNPTTSKAVFSAQVGTSTGLRLWLGAALPPDSRKLNIRARRLDGDTAAYTPSTADNPTGFFHHAGIVNYQAQTARQYVNNSLDGSSDAILSSGITSDTDSTNVCIGGNEGTANNSDIDLAELLVFPTALSDTNRNALHSYLKTKWGTP